MKKRLISILLSVVTMFTFTSCALQYESSSSDGSTGGFGQHDSSSSSESDSSSSGPEQTGLEYTVTLDYNGEIFTDTEGMQAQWTNGYQFYHADFVDGVAKANLTADDYSVTILGMDEKYSYDPCALLHKATSFTPNVTVPMCRIVRARGDGSAASDYKRCTSTGVYRAEFSAAGQKIFYQFEPEKNGTYYIQSWVDVGKGLVNPKLHIYYSNAGGFVQYGFSVDEGYESKGFTRNFYYELQWDETNVGGALLFAISADHRNGDLHDYENEPISVDFCIDREKEYERPTYEAKWMVPETFYGRFETELKRLQGFTLEKYLEETADYMKQRGYGDMRDEFAAEYEALLALGKDPLNPEVDDFKDGASLNYAIETKIRDADTEYTDDGEPIYDDDCCLKAYLKEKIQQWFDGLKNEGKLVGAESKYIPEGQTTSILALRGVNYEYNSKTGVYHKYSTTLYADDPYGYGAGFGPVLYGQITSPTTYIPMALSSIEYAGNKALTLVNEKDISIRYNYKAFIEGYAKINEMANSPIDASGQLQGMPFGYPKELIGVLGFADFVNADGLVPVTPELKQFFQDFSVSQRLFNDGNGVAEMATPRVDSLEKDQWLFACCFYATAVELQELEN